MCRGTGPRRGGVQGHFDHHPSTPHRPSGRPTPGGRGPAFSGRVGPDLSPSLARSRCRVSFRCRGTPRGGAAAHVPADEGEAVSTLRGDWGLPVAAAAGKGEWRESSLGRTRRRRVAGRVPVPDERCRRRHRRWHSGRCLDVLHRFPLVQRPVLTSFSFL